MENQFENQGLAGLAEFVKFNTRVPEMFDKVEGGPIMVVPNGYTVHDLEKDQAAPRRARSSAAGRKCIARPSRLRIFCT